MANAMTSVEEKIVARPLQVLAPLMKEDLEAAKVAADEASRPHFEAFALKLVEASSHFEGRPRAELYSWVHRNFKIRESQTKSYLSLGKTLANSVGTTRLFSSLTDYERRGLGYTRTPPAQRDMDWRQPVKNTLSKVDVETLNIRRDELKRAEEREAQRQLALQLIDIGYKALASKLHPDKGGSRDAMARLNQVRDRLKGCA